MKKFNIEKKLAVQVKYFEELYLIKDASGEVIFTGTPEMAKKIMRLLKKPTKKRGRK